MACILGYALYSEDMGAWRSYWLTHFLDQARCLSSVLMKDTAWKEKSHIIEFFYNCCVVTSVWSLASSPHAYHRLLILKAGREIASQSRCKMVFVTDDYYFTSSDVSLPFAFVAFFVFLSLAYVIIPVEYALPHCLLVWCDTEGPHHPCWVLLCLCYINFLLLHVLQPSVSSLRSISMFQKLFLFNVELEELKSLYFSSKPLFMDV